MSKHDDKKFSLAHSKKNDDIIGNVNSFREDLRKQITEKLRSTSKLIDTSSPKQTGEFKSLFSSRASDSSFQNDLFKRQLTAKSSEKKFDLIISNPPYFSQSLRASNPSRNAARHDDSLPMEAFLKQTKRLLQPHGVVALVLPIGAFERWTEAAAQVGMHIVRVCHVFTSAQKQATRVLLELECNESEEPEIQSLLIQDRNGEKSESYKELTRAFYTKW